MTYVFMKNHIPIWYYKNKTKLVLLKYHDSYIINYGFILYLQNAKAQVQKDGDCTSAPSF